MTTSISTRARSHLRSLAHELNPTVQVGNEGLSEGVHSAVDVALERHELIKVRLGSGFEGDRKDAGKTLAEQAGADLTQVIGRVVVLYRARVKELPGVPRIVLPKTKVKAEAKTES